MGSTRTMGEIRLLLQHRDQPEDKIIAGSNERIRQQKTVREAGTKHIVIPTCTAKPRNQ